MAITTLASQAVDRSMLRQLARQSHQYWASDFLLLDGSTVNTDAVQFTFSDSTRNNICSLLRTYRSRWEEDPMPRLAGNSTKLGM